MQKSVEKKLGKKKIGAVRRKSVGESQKAWVKTGFLDNDKAIPFVISPAIDGLDLIEWAGHNRDYIDELLLKHRALLFRGFDVSSLETFDQFVMATSNGEKLAYRDRTTPRTTEGNGIYTSTVHPADQVINLHTEGDYWLAWAQKLFFCCLTAPSKGGETPLADVRNVYKRIDPEIIQKFYDKGMMLVRNLNSGFGLTWQETFQTEDKLEVEEYCKQNQIEIEWKEGDHLRTRQIRPAIRKHPRTGEFCWFNHAAFYHYTTLEPEIRDALIAEFGEEGLPYNTYYGDGSPITPEEAENIRNAYLQEKIVFPWQEGDITLLDNMSVAHAREPYEGDRYVVVAMTDGISGSDLN